MNQHSRVSLAMAILLLLPVSAMALQGVIEQAISFKDDKQVHYSFTVSLKRDPNPVHAYGYSNFTSRGGFGWADANWKGYAESTAAGTVEASCTEDLDNGNFNGGEGVTTPALQGTLIAKSAPKLSLVLTDSQGSCEVEVRQKTFHQVTMKFERNDADNQDKTFKFTIASVDVAGTTNRTSLNWSGSTATSSALGGGLGVGVDGQGITAQASGTWSQTVDQGVDSIVVVAEGDFDHRRSVTLSPGILEHTFAISVAMDPSASIKDRNSFTYFWDRSVLSGEASYGAVVFIGKITLTANNDKSPAKTVKFNGAEPGDPRSTNDVASDNAQNQPVIPKQP